MIGLLLSLAATSISFILLLIDKREDKKRQIVLSLATIGFLIILGQQFLSYFSSKASEQIFKNLDERTKIINTKTTRIDSNLSMLQVLISKMDKTSIKKIGVEVKSLEDLESLHAFNKGNPQAWEKYQVWLMTPSEGKKALKFITNAGRNYHHSLILLYLMTDMDNRDFVRFTIRSHAEWSIFPRASDWAGIDSSNPLCDLIVFENQQGNILGFAETKEFIKDIRYVIQTQRTREFEQAMNIPNKNFTKYAMKNLSSFNISAKGHSLQDVSTSMIDKNISETVSDINSGRYYLSLSSLFQLK